MQCSALVQGFTGSTDVELSLPCTYDFEVAASRYLHALRRRQIPVLLLFSGTVFTAGHGLRRRAGAVGPRGPLPAAGRGLAGADGRSTSPARGGCGWTDETLARFAAYKAVARPNHWDDAWTCWPPGLATPG